MPSSSSQTRPFNSIGAILFPEAYMAGDSAEKSTIPTTIDIYNFVILTTKFMAALIVIITHI